MSRILVNVTWNDLFTLVLMRPSFSRWVISLRLSYSLCEADVALDADASIAVSSTKVPITTLFDIGSSYVNKS